LKGFAPIVPEPNFHHALLEAERLGMSAQVAALTQSLGVFAESTRNFAVAARLFARLAEYGKRFSDSEMESVATTN
jgi:hypothetical protein